MHLYATWNAEAGLDLNFRVRQEVSEVTNIQALQLSSLLHVGWVVSTVKQEREAFYRKRIYDPIT